MSVSYRIRGGHPLRGSIAVKGSPMAAMAIIASSLLVPDKVTITNIPHLHDLDKLLDELRGLEIAADWTHAHEITVYAAHVHPAPKIVPTSIVGWSPLLLVALTIRCGVVKLEIGELGLLDERLSEFVAILEKFGGKAEWHNGVLSFTLSHQHGARIQLEPGKLEESLVACLLAATADGESQLTGLAAEPEVEDLLDCLGAMGIYIHQSENSEVTMSGSRQLRGTNHSLVADRFEGALFAMAGVLTGGDILIEGLRSNEMMSYLVKLQQLGASYQVSRDGMRFWADSRAVFQSIDAKVASFPGLGALWMCILLPAMCRASGESQIMGTDPEVMSKTLQALRSFGAEVSFMASTITVFGPVKLAATTLAVTDFGSGIAGVLAGLMVGGETALNQVDEVDSRFEDIVQRLQQLGARIDRIE